MKKFILFLLMTAAVSSNAQDAYNNIKEKAQDLLTNPATNDMLKDIAQFKIDALDYLAMKMREEMPDSNITYLDKQALAMNDFVSLYIKRIIELNDEPKAIQVKMTKYYMDASYSNPLFRDKDHELTLSYFNNPKAFLRFSLDTDWIKAVEAALDEKKR